MPSDLHAWVSEHVSTTDAEAIVFGGNGFRAVGAIAALEADLGRAVVTPNQALLWAALRVADADVGSVTDYGRLFGHS
jgi:maleate isomerase